MITHNTVDSGNFLKYYFIFKVKLLGIVIMKIIMNH